MNEASAKSSEVAAPAPGKLFQLIYLSSATRLFSKEELVALLTHSRSNNSRNRLTGMLLYKDGNIMQVLEGERATVERVFDVIKQDPRHKDIIVLVSAEVASREFGEWSMGFRDLQDPAIKLLPGYSEFLNKSLAIEEFAANPSAAQRLLRVFANEPR